LQLHMAMRAPRPVARNYPAAPQVNLAHVSTFLEGFVLASDPARQTTTSPLATQVVLFRYQ
jgi:hypothetical protein